MKGLLDFYKSVQKTLKERERVSNMKAGTLNKLKNCLVVEASEQTAEFTEMQ